MARSRLLGVAPEHRSLARMFLDAMDAGDRAEIRRVLELVLTRARNAEYWNHQDAGEQREFANQMIAYYRDYS